MRMLYVLLFMLVLVSSLGRAQTQTKPPVLSDRAGGGGNTLYEPPSNPVSVQYYVEKDPNFIKEVVAVLLREQFSFVTELGSGPYGQARQLLFSKNHKGQTVYQVLKAVKFDVLMTGPCIDPSGAEKDAAAFVEKNSICLSAQRISRNVSDRALPVQLYALVIHELSHFMGTDEEQAELLQGFIRSSLGENFRSAFWNSIFVTKSSFKDIQGELNTLVSGEKKSDDPEICNSLGFISAHVSQFSSSAMYGESMNSGVSIFSPHNFALAGVGLSTEINIIANSFCSQDTFQVLKQQTKIDGNGYALISTFVEPKSFSKLLDPIKLPIPESGNREQLLQGLVQINDQIEKLKEVMPKLTPQR